MKTDLAMKKAKAEVFINKALRKVNTVLGGIFATACGTTVFADNTAYDVNTTLITTLNLVFNLMFFGGVLFVGYGVVIIGRTISSPDSSDPHSMTKAVGAVVGGLLMIFARGILSLIGVNISDFNLVSNSTN